MEDRRLDLTSPIESAAFDPREPPAPAPPERWWGSHLGELRWQLELSRLLVDPVYYGLGIPHGDGAPVIAIPGFLAGDASLAVMRDWLSRIGYRPHPSRIVANVDCSDRAVNALEHRLERVAERSRRRVVLIGHSRGAHFAKALAVRRPELIASVISLRAGLDTQFDISVPTHAAVAAVRRVLALTDDELARSGCFTATCRCAFARDYGGEFPSQVPLTSIYSRRDGVVRWRAFASPTRTASR
jgi:pimeloyl-ACP methyl ester carboxylesterase